MIAESPRRSPRHHLLAGAVLLACLLLAVLASAAYRLLLSDRQAQRGVLYEPLPSLPVPSDALYGVNVALQQYATVDELRKALTLVSQSGLTWVRQHFPWAEIEPSPGEYDWTRWDRLVDEVRRQGLELIAVLDTSPQWARSPTDRDNLFAPPQYVTTYGLFVRAFAQRYGERITYYEVWDQPNLYPHWGARPIDPAAYVRLLKIASKELRRADADAIVLCAGLAPTTEAGGRNMSEVSFLRGMYDAGGRGLFDVVAAKPYGFWSGPEDRRVDAGVLNFSRLILLREEMVRRGDGHVPIWAVEFGWNALPEDWQGQASPWGTDTPVLQADRSARAIQRARQEWAWLGPMCWAQLQPAAPADDPSWGFALLDAEREPTIFYDTLRRAAAQPVISVAPNRTGYRLKLGLLSAGALLALIVAVRLWPMSPWPNWFRHWAARYQALPEWMQWTLLGLLLLGYKVVPGTVPSLAILALASALIYLRLDIGLAYAVLVIPFFLYPKAIFGKSFSLVETLVLICALARLWHWLRRDIWDGGVRSSFGRLSRWLLDWWRSLNTMDYAVLALLLLAVVSLRFSANLGVSIRELRVIIIEPVLLYFLLRQSAWTADQRMHLADALLLSGVAISLIGLYQYVGGGDVIVAEGVRRIRGVYASPNNLSLLLGRIVPLGVAVLVAGKPPRRWVYGIALLVMLPCLFLTYSRGAWLLGLPAALLAIGLLRGRRVTFLIVGAIALGLLILLPLAGTARLRSLLDWQEGTTFRRLKLWEAAVDMIRDHPITGVGLDNFLYQYPNYIRPEAWQEPDLSHPHNIILDYWTRLGIGGVGVLLWLIVAFFHRALRLYRGLADGNQRAIILGWIASMVGMLAHGMIDNSYFLVDLAFIFFLTLGWVRTLDAVPVVEAATSRQEP